MRGALITAAGMGTRMGLPTPKQFLDLNGFPLLAWTLRAFEQHPMVDLMVVTVPPGHETFCRMHIVQRYGFAKVRSIVAGGSTRQESVYQGLLMLQDTDFVAIHDGARPLVSRDTITACYDAAESVGAALACVPVRDTMKKRIGDQFQTIDRSGLWLAHTPQTFRTTTILEAHRTARQNGFEATDDVALIESEGHPVAAVEDSRLNIKITTPEDLRLAGLLSQQILLDRGGPREIVFL